MRTIKDANKDTDPKKKGKTSVPKGFVPGNSSIDPGFTAPSNPNIDPGWAVNPTAPSPAPKPVTKPKPKPTVKKKTEVVNYKEGGKMKKTVKKKGWKPAGTIGAYKMPETPEEIAAYKAMVGKPAVGGEAQRTVAEEWAIRDRIKSQMTKEEKDEMGYEFGGKLRKKARAYKHGGKMKVKRC